MEYTDGIKVQLDDNVIFILQGTLHLGKVKLIGTDAVRLQYKYVDGVEITASVPRPVEQIVLIDASLEQIDGMKELLDEYNK